MGEGRGVRPFVIIVGIRTEPHQCHLLARYQINARTELAVRYNDISPLENHHCAVAFQILSLPECNIFANVDLEAFKQIRQVNSAEKSLSATRLKAI